MENPALTEGSSEKMNRIWLFDVAGQQLLREKSVAGKESSENGKKDKLVYWRHPHSAWQIGSVKKEDVENEPNGDRCRYFCMKNYRPAPEKMPALFKGNADLEFNSEYECGNLGKVYQISSNEFELILNYDSETQDYCH